MMQGRDEFHQQKDAGDTPGRYHLLQLIGHGSTGETWLADDPLLHRQVAIKMLPPRNQQNSDYAAYFEREAHSATKLDHPNILPIYDYGEYQRTDRLLASYLVMPYIEGGSLDELIQQQRLSPGEALLLLSQAAEALDYAHTQGVLHSNIKPTNILLRNDRWLLLADFGLTRLVDSAHLTEKEAMIGAPEYLAPEQMQGHGEAASDRYSLAVVAYQLLTGHLPFHTRSGTSAPFSLRLASTPTSPRRWNPALPPACEEVLRRGLAKQPAERYPSAREFVEALTHSLTSPKLHNPTATRRNLLITASLTALAGVGGTWAVTSGHIPFPWSSSPSGKLVPNPDEPIKILRGHRKPVHALAWSPASGSTLLASACNEDATVKLWNLQTFPPQQTGINTSTVSKELHRTQLTLAWSPDGSSLAIGGSDNQGHSNIDIYRSDLSGPVAGLEQGLTLPASTLNGLGWLKQTSLAVVWTHAHNNGQSFSLDLWDTQRSTLRLEPASINGILSPSGYASTYRSLAVSPDGTRLAIGTMQGALVGTAEPVDNQVRWQPASFGLLQYHQNAPIGNAISTLTWTTSGHTLLSITEGNPNAFVYWNITSNTPDKPLQIKVPNDTPNFTAIAMYPNTLKALYAAGTQDGKVYLWDNNAGQLPFRILKGGTIKGRIITLAWSPDGAWLAASYDDDNASIAIWGL